MTVRSWFLSRRALERSTDDAFAALRQSQHVVARLSRDLEAACGETERLREERAFWLLTSSCSDPASHVRLAAALHRADAELQEARGEDPHRASLEETA